MQTSRQATSCSLLGMRVFSQNLSRQSGNIPVPGRSLTMNARSMLRGSSAPRKTITGAIQFFCDFGEARIGQRHQYEEILPEVYKAPEILLQTEWSYPIDIW